MISLLLVGACELLDPTEVVNPNVTEDTFLDLPRISTPWLNGLERQLAITMNQNVVLGELLSDNYFNNRTLTNKVFNIPQIEYTDIDVMTWQSEIHTLRRMAQYALETVSGADETTTPDQRAEFHFFLQEWPICSAASISRGYRPKKGARCWMPTLTLAVP